LALSTGAPGNWPSAGAAAGEGRVASPGVNGSGIVRAGQRRSREGVLGAVTAGGNDDDAGLDRGPDKNRELDVSIQPAE
jgi:hypothetical protein